MNIVKVVSLLGLTFVLAACTPTAEDVSAKYSLPQDLQDCKVYYLKDTSASALTIFRCPNSTTATTEPRGKTSVRTVVIDGKTYTKVN